MLLTELFLYLGIHRRTAGMGQLFDHLNILMGCNFHQSVYISIGIYHTNYTVMKNMIGSGFSTEIYEWVLFSIILNI